MKRMISANKAGQRDDETSNAASLENWFFCAHFALLLPLSKHKRAFAAISAFDRHANSVNFAVKGGH